MREEAVSEPATTGTEAPSEAPAGRRQRPLWQILLPWAITIACFAFLYTRIAGPAAGAGKSVPAYLAEVFANVSWGSWLLLMAPYSLFFFLIAGTLAPPRGELHFQREAPCGNATSSGQAPADLQQLAAASTQPTTEQESLETVQAHGSATHSLTGGHAVPLSPGKHIADGVSAAESGAIDIAAGISAELNDQVVAGRVAVNAGDRLCAGGVEVRFITVEP